MRIIPNLSVIFNNNLKLNMMKELKLLDTKEENKDIKEKIKNIDYEHDEQIRIINPLFEPNPFISQQINYGEKNKINLYFCISYNFRYTLLLFKGSVPHINCLLTNVPIY